MIPIATAVYFGWLTFGVIYGMNRPIPKSRAVHWLIGWPMVPVMMMACGVVWVLDQIKRKP